MVAWGRLLDRSSASSFMYTVTFWHCRLGSLSKFVCRSLLPFLHKALHSIFHHALPPTPVSPVLGIYTESFKAHPCLCNSPLTAICYSWSFIGSKPCQKTSATCNLRSHSCFSEVTRNDLTTLPTPPTETFSSSDIPTQALGMSAPAKK